MLLLATLLFILLSPGMVLTLPPGSLGIWGSQQTTSAAILIHAIAFYTLLKLTHDKIFPFDYLNWVETQITGQNF